MFPLIPNVRDLKLLWIITEGDFVPLFDMIGPFLKKLKFLVVRYLALLSECSSEIKIFKWKRTSNEVENLFSKFKEETEPYMKVIDDEAMQKMSKLQHA